MKNFTLMRSLLCLLLAIPLAVSCYDDTDIQNKIDILVDKVYSIEQRINSEFKTLHDMLDGKILISDVSINATTNVTTLTLSNGVELQLLPKTDLKSFVTYLKIGGVDYWAYVNADGTKELFKDAAGQPVPVQTDVPEVVVEDGDYYIIVGGMKYPLGGNSVFSDYEVVTDEVSGEVLAVTFTFGEDMTFTVTVDGTCGFHFLQPGGLGNAVIIDNYYVACGLTASVQVEMRGVEDYVLQAPEGWRVKERADVYTGEKYFDITAPSYARVQNNEVDAEGYLKVVAVLQGGKATTAKLFVTTNPFKKFGPDYGKINIARYNGLERYFYGICPASEYDEETIMTTVEGLLEAYEYPAGYAEASENLVDMPVAEVLAADPAYGEEYILWALPMQYYSDDEDAYYYLHENTIVYEPFTLNDVTFEVSDVAFSDAALTMNMQGVTSYYSELVLAEDFMLEDVLSNLHRGTYEPKTVLEYSGSLFEFAGVTAASNTAYVAWFAADRADKKYSSDDVIVREFSTLGLLPDGSVEIKAGDAEPSALDVEVNLAASGAQAIYYAFLTTTEAKKYATDQAKAEYVYVKGLSAQGTSAVARLSEFTNIKPKLNTKYVLLALALDKEGKYKNVLVEEYTTTNIPFNDMKVNVVVEKNVPGDVQLSIKAEGAVEFLYWFGKTSDNTWTSTNYLGADATKAEVYMFLNSSGKIMKTSMENYPIKNGMISSTELELGVQYGIVVMAKDTEGTWSHATLHKFTALPLNIGKVVLQSDPKWEAARPTVTYLPESFEPGTNYMFGKYAYTVTIPEGYTAYVVSASIETYNYEWAELSLEDWIVDMMTTADHFSGGTITVDETKEFPYDSEYHYFEHGSSQYGNSAGSAVIWASQAFHDKACAGHKSSATAIINGIEIPARSIVNINDGNPVRFYKPSANGNTQKVSDQVYIVVQDTDFNCYYPYVYDVPVEYFVNAKEK